MRRERGVVNPLFTLPVYHDGREEGDPK